VKVNFHLEPKGNLRIWETSKFGEEYVIGADVGDGVAGGDPSCAQVLRRSSFKQVAVWHGIEEPYEFGRTLSLLGYFYNTALLAPEVNASGSTTVKYLSKISYPNIYRTKILDHEYPEDTDRIGWRTNVHTRRLIIDFLRACVKENSLLLYDPDTLDELKTTVKNPDTGKIEASPGNHDDRMMALAIAAFVCNELVESTGISEESYVARFNRYEEGGVKLGRGGYFLGLDKNWCLS